ncbi:uncharacterized protein LOC134195007 [Corticium candelabrum]|uniref:uncharacterized protein LOC134195007 n=1 Tax=Corticium candelabrum TaxID=121492 RepID=UPI002E277281|nr:uncharacterized protein LOC134195007 [Corticium candelabrum]
MRPTGRTLWIKPRESRWWDRMRAEASDTDWRENFRMSRGTFMSLCNDIRHLITKKSTHLRVPISPEKRLALTLYRLAGSEYYRTVSNLFGVGVSTASTISNEVCQAIVSHLSGQYVQMPQGDRLKKVIERFRNIGHGFPQIGGAVDGSHIPIKSPPLNPACYINRKGFHSIILQAVVDSFLYFNDICIGWPGRVHDARVLANSRLFAVAEHAGTAFPGSETVVCNGARIPVLILGDPAYPLKSWLMKAYPESANMRESEKSFNYKLSCARIAVERAFGLLKGRWRILLNQQETDINNVQVVVIACCTLHNYCLAHNEINDDYSETETICDLESGLAAIGRRDMAAPAIRDNIRDYLDI